MTQQKELRLSYLASSYLSGFIELGAIVLMVLNSGSLVEVLIAGSLYQMGNLLSSTARLTRKTLLVVLVLALSSTIAFHISGNPFFFFSAVGTVSWGLHRMRRLAKLSVLEAPVSTFSKRVARIGGFITAGIVGTEILIVLAGLTLLIASHLALVLKNDWRNIPHSNIPRRSSLSDIMTIHQAHYFSYAYIVPIILLMKLSVPVIYVGCVFVIGWLSYIYSERLLGKYRLSLVFTIGHILVASSLFFMWVFSDSLIGVLLFWFISGFGGGTVFCIKRLNEKEDSTKQVELDFWEDLGHVLGVAIVILIVWVLQLRNEADVFLISAMIATIAAGMMLKYQSNRLQNINLIGRRFLLRK